MNGRHTSLGYCWACGPRPRTTAPSPLPSWCTAPPWYRRFFGARAARPGFYPYQTHPPAPTGDQPATAAGAVGGTLPPLTPPYAGPYAVAKAGEKTFEVLVGGQQQRISVDRLKPHTGPAPVTAAAPARRGRPPKERTAVVAATTRTYAEVVAGGGSL
jgi:hypothetical protein